VRSEELDGATMASESAGKMDYDAGVRIAVLMPAFNEEGRLARTLGELGIALAEAHAQATVFLVDDGSLPPIDEAALSAAAPAAPSNAAVRIVLARHPVNLGQGAALETARRLALDPRWQPSEGAFEAFVTMDSDGQHRGSDVLALASAIAAGADVALGDRFAGGSHVPTSRHVLLAFARVFERVTTGLALSDVHNGLRAFGPRAIASMRIRQNRMAHATEITRRISRASAERGADDRLRVVEVPVSVRYTGESMAKGQRASGAVAIVVDLFHGFLFNPHEPPGPR
jgi:glycosyltransferase involved in cell wall biosynthesis